ncbi:response regulator transcription factor [Acidobacteria bacterium AH-259-L09]|nr:response regulator transcription factor [Acidobacteria bacterium AH-259-L09]
MTRILVVEDEPTIAAGLQDDLELEGYTVEVVEDGATAVDRALEGGYDLILLDVMLPQKDGFTVCREVRQAGLCAPIILLTAKGQEVDKVLGLELGADDYVTKPFSPRELLARIKAVLRRTNDSAQPAQVYQFGDVKVDFGRCEVSRTGKKVDLTAMEFKILRAFLSHPGQVLTLDQLIEEVWGRDVFLSDRVIYTHISNLRNKIEANPAQPRHLITVRGMGYRFDS